MKMLNNVAEIVEVLGGPKALQILTSAKRQAVHNWIGYFERFPPNTYFVMIERLKELGYTAPPYLWKMRKKVKAQAAASKKSSNVRSKVKADSRKTSVRKLAASNSARRVG